MVIEKYFLFVLIFLILVIIGLCIGILVKCDKCCNTNLENLNQNFSTNSMSSIIPFNVTGNVSYLKLNNYNIYVFNSSGSINFLQSQKINYILVGGGGAGGNTGGYPGSGGGGGGGITISTTPVSVIGIYTVNVGLGGTNITLNGGSSSICKNKIFNKNCLATAPGGSVGLVPKDPSASFNSSGYGGDGGKSGLGGGIGGTGGFHYAILRDYNWNRTSTKSSTPTSVNYYGCTGESPTSSALSTVIKSIGLNLSVGNGGGGGGALNNGGGNGGGAGFNAGPQSLTHVGSGGGGGGGGTGGVTGASGYFITGSGTGGNGGTGGAGGYNPVPVTGPYTSIYSYGNGGGGSGVRVATGYNGGNGSNGVVIIYF